MNGFFSSVAGATLRWLDLPGEGLPLVFIHGLGCASSYDYPRVASDPALNGRRKILIDLPGFGYSDKPHDFSYNIHNKRKLWSRSSTTCACSASRCMGIAWVEASPSKRQGCWRSE